jgi:hypothetical protein
VAAGQRLRSGRAARLGLWGRSLKTVHACVKPTYAARLELRELTSCR